MTECKFELEDIVEISPSIHNLYKKEGEEHYVGVLFKVYDIQKQNKTFMISIEQEEFPYIDFTIPQDCLSLVFRRIEK